MHSDVTTLLSFLLCIATSSLIFFNGVARLTKKTNAERTHVLMKVHLSAVEKRSGTPEIEEGSSFL